MGLGDKILENRKKLGISQEELAEKLDVSRQTISKWETDKSVPELEKLVKLSEIFNVSVDELIKENEKEAETENAIENETENETKNEIKSEIENEKEERKEETNDKKEKNKKKFKIKGSLLLKIALVFLAIVIAICVVLFFYRKDVMEDMTSLYKERYENIGEKYSAKITEVLENLDDASNYEYSNKEYTYFVQADKKIVRIDYYKTEISDDPDEVIYIDLNKNNSNGYCYYDDVVVIDTLANTYQEVDNYEFESPIYTATRILNYDQGIIKAYGNLANAALNIDNIVARAKDTDVVSYIWNINKDKENFGFALGDYECIIGLNRTKNDGVKEVKERKYVYMCIVDIISEEEVTPPSSEDYTVIQ